MLSKNLQDQIAAIDYLFNEYIYMNKNKINLKQFKADILKIIASLEHYSRETMINLAIKYQQLTKKPINALNMPEIQEIEQFDQEENKSQKFSFSTMAQTSEQFYHQCNELKLKLLHHLAKITTRMNTLQVENINFSNEQKEQFYYQISNIIANNNFQSLEQYLNENIVDLNYKPSVDDEILKFDTLLLTAVRKANLNIIKILVNNGADINLDVEENQRPLYIPILQSIIYRDFEITQYLLENGASCNFYDSLGGTPLCYVFDFNYDFFEKMITNKYNININYLTPIGTILHYVCQNKKAVILLLENGIDLNAVDENNQTALHVLINNYKNNTGDDNTIMQLLINEGINIKIQNNRGQTALDLAIKLDLKQYVEYFLVSGRADLELNRAEQLAKQLKRTEILNIISRYKTNHK